MSSTRVLQNQDENNVPGIDQSGAMAGKVTARRSVLGSLNTNITEVKGRS